MFVFLLCGATGAVLWQMQSISRASTATEGGTYVEGAIGSVKNLNPLFTSGSLEESASRLLFNGLLKYDTDGKLVNDLASSMKVDETKKIYTLTLKENILWHDGQPFTAEDVVYTITAIQNPETRSTAFASWQGVKVSSANNKEVTFELPAPFAPFPGSLVVPIVPKHLLADIPTDKLRTSSFNTSPVGTGPFVFSVLRSEANSQQKVEFLKNVKFHQGAPKLDKFIIQTYEDDDMLSEALRQREITAALDLKAETVTSFAKDTSIRSTDIPLNSGVFAFFKTTNELLKEPKLRVALAQAIDRQSILQLYKGRYATLKTPLLKSQLGYDAEYMQKTNKKEAEKALDALGWVKKPSGVREKDGARLEFELTTVNNAQYNALAADLQKQWATVGVKIKSQLLSPEQLQQNALSSHSYDILLYGISIGHDPDVYAYWHSSQARDGGRNFSEWKSARADSSLETARTRQESVLRVARYKTFQDEWVTSAPAVALYQPRVNYSFHQNANGFVQFASNSAADRFTNVQDWTVSTKTVTKTP